MQFLNGRRRSDRRLVAAPVVLSIALMGLVLGCSAPADDAGSDGSAPPTTVSAELDGTSMPPWVAPTDVPARVASAGLDLGPMGTAEHYHPQLRIVIGDKDVAVPANIGVDPATAEFVKVNEASGCQAAA